MTAEINGDILAPDHIEQFITCSACYQEMPGNVAPAEWARLNVGFTETGIQIWCVRHQLNVADINVGEDMRPDGIAGRCDATHTDKCGHHKHGD